MDALHVLREVLKPVETTLAIRLVTSKSPLVVVSILVLDLVAFRREPPAAQLALEGLLTCVDSGVHLQIGQLIELHSADLHSVYVQMETHLGIHLRSIFCEFLPIFVPHGAQNAHIIATIG